MKRVIVLALLFVVAVSLKAYGQDRQQRRELIQGLLQGLIDSDARPRGSSPAQGTRVQQRPARVEATEEVIQARRRLEQWSQQATDLVKDLRRYELESPQLRPILVDAMRFQVAVDGLYRRAQISPNLDSLRNDFAALDRDWRLINTRIQSTRGVPQTCTTFVNSINDLDTNLSDLFHIQPTVDRVELGRLATTMENDFEHLLRGVYFSGRGTAGGEQLIRDGQQLQTKIGQAASLVQRGSYPSMVNAYKACLADWRGFSRRVLDLRDDRLRYSIQHIEDTGFRIQEQLFIPIELDRDYLISSVRGMVADCDQVFGTITMGHLLQHQNPQRLMQRSQAFKNACIELGQKLQNGESEEQLEWVYRSFSNKWDALIEDYGQLNLPAVNRQLENITLSVASIGNSLNADATLSHDELVHLFSELDAVSRQAAFDSHQHISQQRYGTDFPNRINNGFDRFQRVAYDLHRQSIRPTFKVQPNALAPMFNQWGELRSMIDQVDGNDRQRFNSHRQQIEPMMVKLQILYGN